MAAHQHLDCTGGGARLRKCIGNGLEGIFGYRDSRESECPVSDELHGFGEIGRFVDPDTDDFLLGKGELTQIDNGRSVVHGYDHDASPNGRCLREGRRDTGVPGAVKHNVSRGVAIFASDRRVLRSKGPEAECLNDVPALLTWLDKEHILGAAKPRHEGHQDSYRPGTED